VKIDFQPTAQCEAASLSAFLGRRFPGADAAFLAEEHMAWKYWSARPDWAGSRSFTARHDGAIVAHAAAWPVRVCVPGQIVPAVHLIDWTADPEHPGAGLWLLRQIGARVSVMIATGGSEITRRILPVIGFRPHGELCTFARPVRPLRLALATTPKNWRLPARLLRNAFWRLSWPLSVPRGWSVRPLAPEEVPEELWPRPSPGTAVTARDTAFYRYFVDSPSARHELFGLERSRELVGYFCLAFAPHVARIADLWLPSTKVEDWCAGFRAAAAVAARERDVHEVSAWASTALGKEALRRAGFRLRDRAAVSLLDQRKVLEGRTLHAQMLDCDASFFSGEVGSYLT
jgi:Acetyltransferase (GNAT) domain